MKQALAKRIVPVLVLLFAAPCFGWGRDGHKIISEIATHRLTPEAKVEVRALLGDQSLVDVCTWADEIRSDPAYRWASPLHYANVEPGDDSFDLERHCPEHGCVVSAIIKYTEVLGDREASSADRTEALKFLVHFVEDIHQPMHVSHARDRGGNDIKVEFFHDRTNLHRVWDSALIRHTKKPWTTYAAELQATLTPEQATEWEKATSPVDWATETYELAVTCAYEVPADGQLGQAYFERCIPIAEKRLTMAGVRLAHLLNTVFGDGQDVDATKPAPR